MAVPNSGDWPINPTSTTGNDLADKLNRLSAAVMSSFANPTRPSGITAGMFWARPSGTNYQLMNYNGTRDTVVATISTTGAVTYTGVYTQTQVDNLITGLQNQINALVVIPKGLISMWAGSNASIPSGWYLCNGSNGTPDLRNRFIVGSGSSYATGATGGSNTISTVPAHTHGYSGTTSDAGSHGHSASASTAGQHTHSMRSSYGGSSSDRIGPDKGPTGADDDDGTKSGIIYSAGNHTHSITVNSAGTHDHSYSGTTKSTGSSTVDIRPLYYALAFIQKA